MNTCLKHGLGSGGGYNISDDDDDGGDRVYGEEEEGGGWIVKSCPASFAGQLLHCSNTLAGQVVILLHCSNTFAGQVSPNPAARMTSTRAVHCL